MDADIALFDKVKKGDIVSFETIFEKYYMQLCGYCNTVVKDPESAEEIVSDVFAYIWQKKKEINLKSNLRSYLFRSVKNLSLTKLRGVKWQSEELSGVHETMLMSVNHTDKDLLAIDFNDRLEGVIKQMPKQRQLIFRMSRIEGLSYNEIAIALSISPRTVQNHMVEAIKYMNAHKEELMKLAIAIGFLIIGVMLGQ